ncbi:hypothetical protein CF327_g334 [Tilletia walkeri]|nr:hypothetical protein CF327_g334 [Tilletia walkeri]
MRALFAGPCYAHRLSPPRNNRLFYSTNSTNSNSNKKHTPPPPPTLTPARPAPLPPYRRGPPTTRLVRWQRPEEDEQQQLIIPRKSTSAATFSFHQPFSFPSSSKSATSRIRQPSSSSLFSFYPATTATLVSRQADIDGPSSSNTSTTTTSANSSVKMSSASSNAGLTQRKVDSAAKDLNGSSTHAHEHHDHDHAHSHSLNPFAAHSHSHGHDQGSAAEADALLAALRGKGDRGSNITLLGLFANLVLSASKGLAGVYLNSAALLADAAHSLSDMFSDLVTLFCWKMSQLPASESHPLGYGKYETMGGLGVSLVLVAGSLGIGFHSWGLLLEALQPTLAHAPHAIQVLSSWTGSVASVGAHLHDHGGAEVGGHGHSHGHGAEGGLLDPNAMWFALLSILVKEWLYHATLKIAREENSSVLEANAIHHRSDSLSSGVTFLAIGGSWLGFPILDPLGGLLVAALIGKQGAELLLSALGELSDRGVERETLDALKGVLDDVHSKEGRMKGWHTLRAIKSGVSIFIDVTLVMPPETTLAEARAVESAVVERLRESRKGVKEVRVQLSTAFPKAQEQQEQQGGPRSGNGKAE